MCWSHCFGSLSWIVDGLSWLMKWCIQVAMVFIWAPQISSTCRFYWCFIQGDLFQEHPPGSQTEGVNLGWCAAIMLIPQEAKICSSRHSAARHQPIPSWTSENVTSWNLGGQVPSLQLYLLNRVLFSRHSFNHFLGCCTAAAVQYSPMAFNLADSSMKYSSSVY